MPLEREEATKKIPIPKPKFNPYSANVENMVSS
jgi:hypothetical protein